MLLLRSRAGSAQNAGARLARNQSLDSPCARPRVRRGAREPGAAPLQRPCGTAPRPPCAIQHRTRWQLANSPVSVISRHSRRRLRASEEERNDDERHDDHGEDELRDPPASIRDAGVNGIHEPSRTAPGALATARHVARPARRSDVVERQDALPGADRHREDNRAWAKRLLEQTPRWLFDQKAARTSVGTLTPRASCGRCAV